MSQILALIAEGALEPAADGRGRSIEQILRGWPADSVLVEDCPGARLGISRMEARAVRYEPLVIDANRRVAVVYDGRIDNCGSLRSDLGLSSGANEPEILLSAYERWASDLGLHLVGDFCCVFWDWGRQKYLALRDQLGVRPLYYCELRNRIYIGSDVELIAAAAKLPGEPDDRCVIEHLVSERSSTNRSFWKSIARLPGGHYLHGTPGASGRIEQYWRPMAASRSIPSSQADVREEFKRRFYQSVARRLTSQAGVMSHLSGGLDSSLIVCVGAELTRTPDSPDRLVATLTERFPGKAWDEGDFVDAVTKWTGVPSLQWTTTDGELVEVSRPVLAGPGMDVARTSGSSQDLHIARERGIRVVLCGEGGDQLGAPFGLGDDRAARVPVMLALSRLVRPAISARDRLVEARAMLRRCAPAPLRRMVGMRRYRRSLPPWLRGQWNELAVEAFAAVHYPRGYGRQFPYHVQQAHWNILTSGTMATALDLRQRTAAKWGMELRFPFLDVELVEFVLALAPNDWVAEGPGARLHRDLLGEVLPPSVRARRSKAIFSARVGERLRAGAAIIERLFSHGDWLSDRYVDRSVARELLGRAASRPLTEWRTYWAEWLDVRAIAALEAWLRLLYGYNAGSGDPHYA